MKFLMFIILSFVTCLIVYILCEICYKFIDNLHDKYLYNKGTCRDCGGQYEYIISKNEYNIYICKHCQGMIMIKSQNCSQS